jgi:hypothetical protein
MTATMVQQRPDGAKVIDANKATTYTLAAVGDLQRQADAMRAAIAHLTGKK